METVVELAGGDVGPLLALVDAATFVNIHPGIDAEPARPARPLGNMFGARGPRVPIATWTPGEIGIQHGTGPRLVPRLEDAGLAVPSHWYVVADHPKHGLVVRTYDSPLYEVLTWLVRSTELVCPLPIDRPWRATVHT